jgi:hypothetical protein
VADFTPYRATKAFHIGQIRVDVKPGDVLLFNGITTQIAGVTHTIPLVEKVIKAGWLIPAPEAFALVVAPVVAPEPEVKPEPVAPFASGEAKAADGNRPEAGKQHVWGGSPSDWLNSEDGMTCKVCGVTLLNEGRLIRADRMRGNGKQQFHYRDAHGVQFSAFTELSCPAYIGDAASAAAQTKEVVRNVRGQVDAVEGRVDGVEDRVETVEARLQRLEAENELLQQQLAERPLVDATQVAEALYALMERKVAESKALGDSGVKHLPLPSLDEVTQEIRVPVPITVEDK